MGDDNRLERVFGNLIDNAESFSPPDGIIRISATRSGQDVIVRIEDDGPGVPKEIRDQIFYPMVSGTASGTGLGLSIAQSIMNQLGGLIECNSEPGNTVFTVFTPLEIL